MRSKFFPLARGPWRQPPHIYRTGRPSCRRSRREFAQQAEAQVSALRLEISSDGVWDDPARMAVVRAAEADARRASFFATRRRCDRWPAGSAAFQQQTTTAR